MSDLAASCATPERRDRRGIAEGLVVVVGQLGQEQLDRVQVDDLVGVVGPEVLRDGACVARARRTPAPRTRWRTFGPGSRRLGHERHDRAGVHPARLGTRPPGHRSGAAAGPIRAAPRGPPRRSSSSDRRPSVVVARAPSSGRCVAHARPTSGSRRAAACGRRAGSSMGRGCTGTPRNRASASRSMSLATSGSARMTFSSDP